MRLRILLLALLLTGLPLAGAQAQEQTPQDPNRPALPDIAPRVVEIRGPLEISLPSLQRQPLVGFNPPPRVTPIPPDRRPFVDAYKQTKAELPPSPLSPPEPPPVAGLNTLPPRSGEAETSFGRYFSRLVHARIESPVARSAAAVFRVDYRGTDGHQPFDGTVDAYASFDALETGLGLRNYGRYATLGVDADGFFNRYPLYAARAATPSVEDGPLRLGSGAELALWARPHGASPVDGSLRLTLGGARYATEAPTEGSQDAGPYERSTGRLTAHADLSVPLAAAEGRFDAAYSTAGLDAGSLLGRTVQSFDGAAGAFFRAGRRFDLTAGARLLAFSSERQELGVPSDVAISGTYVSPDVRLNMYPMAGVTLFAENRPGADLNPLAALFRTNPYLVHEPRVLPTIRTVDAAAGTHVFAGPLEFQAEAGYTRSPNYLFFERGTLQETVGYGTGLSRAAYGRAAILHVGGDVSIVLPAGLHASAGVTLRDGTLLDDDVDIPYFGPLVGRGSLSYSFLGSRGLLQLDGTYEAARYTDRAQTRRVGDYVDLDASLFYNVTSSIGVVARVENMSFGYLERWEGYEAAPFTVMGGFRVLW